MSIIRRLLSLENIPKKTKIYNQFQTPIHGAITGYIERQKGKIKGCVRKLCHLFETIYKGIIESRP